MIVGWFVIIDIAISAVFLLVLALVIINGRQFRVGTGEKPIIYSNVVVQFFLNISLLTFIALSIYLLFFYNWRLFLILLLAGFLTETFVIVPFVEKTLGRLYLWITRRTEDE